MGPGHLRRDMDRNNNTLCAAGEKHHNIIDLFTENTQEGETQRLILLIHLIK